MINAGQYDQRITLQQRVSTIDALGQESQSWIDASTVWAKVRPLKGRDFFAAAQQQATIDVQFCIRYRVDVDATWRVLWGGVAYEVVGHPANVYGANEELEINAVRGVRDGI